MGQMPNVLRKIKGGKIRIRYILLAMLSISLLFALYFWLDSIITSPSVKSPLAIKKLLIFGDNLELNYEQLIGKPLLSIKAKELEQLYTRTDIENLNIRRIFPDTLILCVSKKHPVAYKVTDHGMLLIDKEGIDFMGYMPKGNNKLFEVLGSDYNKNFYNLYNALNKQDIKIKRALYIDQRRWDIILNTDLVVKLPKHGYDLAIEALPKIISQIGKIEEIEVIDLRFLPEKIFIRKKAYAA